MMQPELPSKKPSSELVQSSNKRSSSKALLRFYIQGSHTIISQCIS